MILQACPTLTNPTGGSVTVPAAPVFEDEAVYSCNPGYELSGYNRRCCLSDGEWSGDAPTCVLSGIPIPVYLYFFNIYNYFCVQIKMIMIIFTLKMPFFFILFAQHIDRGPLYEEQCSDLER